MEFVIICIAVCYTLKFTPTEKKVVSELTIPFLSILKLPDKLIKGHPTWENIVNNLTMQTAHGFILLLQVCLNQYRALMQLHKCAIANSPLIIIRTYPLNVTEAFTASTYKVGM